MLGQNAEGSKATRQKGITESGKRERERREKERDERPVSKIIFIIPRRRYRRRLYAS